MTQRGSTMMITLVVLGILSLIGTTLVSTFRTELSVTQARKFLSEARENAEQGLRAFMNLSSDTVLQPGLVQSDLALDALPLASGTQAVPILHMASDQVSLQIRELFCGDDGSSGTGNMLGTGAKRVWFNIESTAFDAAATQARAQINLGASRVAPPNACNY